MLGLPATTEYNKRIPKQKFYDNITVTPSMKRIFIDNIKSIYWRNKIAPSTINVATGEIVTEIEIFEIKLEHPILDESVLRQIDREIHYHIIFLLEYNNCFQVWTSYKESVASGKNPFKVDCYYHTDWMPESELSLYIDGLCIDTVYENFVRQIAGTSLESVDGETLKESVEKSEKKKKLQAEIDRLEKRAWSEPQPKKKFELYTMIKEKKQILEDYGNGQS